MPIATVVLPLSAGIMIILVPLGFDLTLVEWASHITDLVSGAQKTSAPSLYIIKYSTPYFYTMVSQIHVTCQTVYPPCQDNGLLVDLPSRQELGTFYVEKRKQVKFITRW